MATLARWNAAAIDDAGNKMDGCSVEVRRESDNGLASVFSDRDGAVSLGNPFVAADGGNIGFHVVGGAYKITATLGATTRTWRYVGVGLGSETDGGAGDVVGPASAVDDTPMVADGATGKLIKNKTYAAFKALLALVKGDVGLGNVDNTSDANKPVSTAQQTALNLKADLASPALTGNPTAPTQSQADDSTKISTTAYVRAAIAAVLAGVSSSFDTLAEIVAGFIPNSLLTTRGDIIIRNATIPARLGAGTAGQELITAGTSADPAWGYRPPWYSGYVAGRYYNGGLVSTTATGTGALAADILYATPIVVQELHTFDRIAFQVTTAGTATLARVGIYNFANGVPGSLVLDAGTVDVTGTGLKTVTISQALSRGMYVLAIVVNGSVTVQIQNAAQVGSLYESIGTDILGSAAVRQTVAHAFAALPTPFGAPTYSGIIFVQMALRA